MSKFMDKILMRLNKVKKTGSGQYIAICPAHDDKSPSLAITEKDGKCLLHCFAGCTPLDVLDSISLEMGDLFDDDGLVRNDSGWSEKNNARFQSQQIERAQHTLAITDGVIKSGGSITKAEANNANNARKYLIDRNMLGCSTWLIKE